jgi:hypothetical protein
MDSPVTKHSLASENHHATGVRTRSIERDRDGAGILIADVDDDMLVPTQHYRGAVIQPGAIRVALDARFGLTLALGNGIVHDVEGSDMSPGTRFQIGADEAAQRSIDAEDAGDHLLELESQELCMLHRSLTQRLSL